MAAVGREVLEELEEAPGDADGILRRPLEQTEELACLGNQ
jgi:hypothetical protein